MSLIVVEKYLCVWYEGCCAGSNAAAYWHEPFSSRYFDWRLSTNDAASWTLRKQCKNFFLLLYTKLRHTSDTILEVFNVTAVFVIGLKFLSLFIFDVHCVPKKTSHFVIAHSWPNTNRFFKIFHWPSLWTICKKKIINYSTALRYMYFVKYKFSKITVVKMYPRAKTYILKHLFTNIHT